MGASGPAVPIARSKPTRTEAVRVLPPFHRAQVRARNASTAFRRVSVGGFRSDKTRVAWGLLSALSSMRIVFAALSLALLAAAGSSRAEEAPEPIVGYDPDRGA